MCKGKGTENLITTKTIAMQNRKGQERYREQLIVKSKSTNHDKVHCDAQARTGI